MPTAPPHARGQAAEPEPLLGIARVDTAHPLVALTFDDGPDPAYTTTVLRVLRDEGVPATFFVVGSQAQDRPDFLGAEIAAGHEVDCHGWEHVSMEHTGLDAVLRSFEQCARIVTSASGRRPAAVRPPFGLLPRRAAGALEAGGFAVVYWDVVFAGRSPDPKAPPPGRRHA